MAWRVERSEVLVHDEPWLTIRKQAIRTEDGESIDPFFLLDYPDWTNVVAVTDDDEIVMVRQYRHGVGRELLEIPGGVIDATDASPEAAARRELLEETGYEAGRWREVAQLSPNPATHTNLVTTFLATGAERVRDPRPEPGEGVVALTMSIDEVLERMARGELLQALHVAGLLLSLRALGR